MNVLLRLLLIYALVTVLWRLVRRLTRTQPGPSDETRARSDKRALGGDIVDGEFEEVKRNRRS